MPASGGHRTGWPASAPPLIIKCCETCSLDEQDSRATAPRRSSTIRSAASKLRRSRRCRLSACRAGRRPRQDDRSGSGDDRRSARCDRSRMAAYDKITGEREGGGPPAGGAVWQVAKQDGGEQVAHDPWERRAGTRRRGDAIAYRNTGCDLNLRPQGYEPCEVFTADAVSWCHARRRRMFCGCLSCLPLSAALNRRLCYKNLNPQIAGPTRIRRTGISPVPAISYALLRPMPRTCAAISKLVTSSSGGPSRQSRSRVPPQPGPAVRGSPALPVRCPTARGQHHARSTSDAVRRNAPARTGE